MDEIKNILKDVYKQDDLELLYLEVARVINNYSSIDENPTFELSEKDIVLIAYGDQVYLDGKSKLQTLNDLLKERLAEEITIVHLLPFYPFCSDDGFSVIDYYKVNPDMGTWDDIDKLAKNFNLIFDAVANHTSNQCEWFNKYLNDEKPYDEYYIEVDDLSPYNQVTRPRTTPLVHTFRRNGKSKSVWTTFSEKQVDLNFRNPKVFLQTLDVLLFYISKGAQIIRLDAIGFLWKEKNTTCIHLQQTHLLIKAMRKIVQEVDSSVMLLSETNVPHLENISYFGNGDEAHMVYNFTLPPLIAYSILDGNTEKLNNWAQTLSLPNPNVCFFNFLASHDGIGLRPVEEILNSDELNKIIDAAIANGGEVSYKQNPDGSETPYEINSNYFSLLKGPEKEEELGIKRTILAHAILFCMPGLPAIYFHSIFGSENDLKGMKTSGISRRINREKNESEKLNDILNDITSRQAIVLDQIKKLIMVRKTEPAFNPFSEFKFERPGKGIFIIERKSSDGKSIVKAIFNLGFEAAQIELNYPEEKIDLMSNKKYDKTIRLNSLEFCWLKYYSN